MMLDLEPNLKKKKGAAFFELDEDIDQDWIKEHQAFLVEEQRQKIQKKFEKDNEKLVADGEKEMKVKELEERLQVAKGLEKKYNKENKTGKVEAEGKGPSVDKIESSITKLDQRVETMLVQAQDKEDNKEVALGTSKIVSSLCLPSGYSRTCLTLLPELHRPPPHCRLHQEIQRAHRKVLLQVPAREVRMGHQVRRCRLGVLKNSTYRKKTEEKELLPLYTLFWFHVLSFLCLFLFILLQLQL